MVLIKEISVFFPAYNEEENIGKTVVSARKKLKQIAKEFEIIIIDDGSTDKTDEIIKKLSLTDERIKIVRHKQNKGYGASLISGFYNSKYEWIAFMDSDGQFDFLEIERFIQIQKKTNADIVAGFYIKRKVSFLRKLNTYLWQRLIRLLFKLNIKDIDCGFKLVKKEVINKIKPLKSQRGAFISTELLVKAKSKGFKIVEIPVHHFPREEGTPTGSNLRVILNSFKDLFKLRKELNEN